MRRARGGDARFDAAAEDLIAHLSKHVPNETGARFVAERLALMPQGALLVRHAAEPVADAFVATRIMGEGGRSFGAWPAGVDTAAIVRRRRLASEDSSADALM